MIKTLILNNISLNNINNKQGLERINLKVGNNKFKFSNEGITFAKYDISNNNYPIYKLPISKGIVVGI